MWALGKMVQGRRAATVLYRRRREERRIRRLRERQRERIQMREFNATLRALAVSDVERFVEDLSWVDLEGGLASIVGTAW